MQVCDIMTQSVECIGPEESLQTAAQRMRDRNIGTLPVCDQDRLVGMLTDRDIVVRAVADGRSPDTTRVGDMMTQGVNCCFEDDDVTEAGRLMQEKQIRRLAVLNHDNRLVGILSLGDIAVKAGDDQESGHTLERISEPAEPR